MKNLLCKCGLLGIVGILLFIGIATVQGNPMTMWGVGTWTAFIVMLSGFMACAFIQRQKCS